MKLQTKSLKNTNKNIPTQRAGMTAKCRENREQTIHMIPKTHEMNEGASTHCAYTNITRVPH